jgi:predicted NBD/HSP70 family sugar kinase
LPLRVNRQPPSVVADLIHDAIQRAVADAGLHVDQIDGIGVGVPGFIDGATGICHWSPVFRDAGVPFASALRERLQRPVFVDNDANLVALAEHWFGEGTDADELVVVTLEHGVGMGLMLDGRIFRGAHGFAGEFGHTQVVPDGAPCRCGQHGCGLRRLLQALGLAMIRSSSSDPWCISPSVHAVVMRTCALSSPMPARCWAGRLPIWSS